MACIPHSSPRLSSVPNSEVRRDLVLGFDKCDKYLLVGELTGEGVSFCLSGGSPADSRGCLYCVSPISPIPQLGERTRAVGSGQRSAWAASSFLEKGRYLRKQVIWNSVGNTSLIICHSTAGFPKPRSRKKKPGLSPD